MNCRPALAVIDMGVKNPVSFWKLLPRCMSKEHVWKCVLSKKGSCKREREGLLHKFEQAEMQNVDQGPRNLQFQGGGGRGRQQQYSRRPIPRGDVKKIVKSFARSAAGLDKMVAEDLRPAPVLFRTVDYLCHEIVPREEPFHVIYDFVFDRLRSVRQDLVIQRICDISAIQILEIIIRFHVYAAYRLQDEPVEKFDPHINRKHLVDCLKRLICFYESNNYMSTSRYEFEALYLIATPETNDSLIRAIGIRRELNSKLLDKAVELVLAREEGNYVKLFSLMQYFPTLAASFFTQQIRSIRSSALAAMTAAYGVSTSKVPVLSIAKLLRYSSVRDAIDDLTAISAQIVYDGEEGERVPFAKFNKSNAQSCISKSPSLCRDIAGIGLEELRHDNRNYRLQIAAKISPK